MHPSQIDSDSSFPPHVRNVLDSLKNEPETESIWLIGSRANGTEKTGSDWDFMIFVRDPVSKHPVRSEAVDVIRVDPQGRCLLEGQPLDLIHSLETWRWRQTGPKQAQYSVRISPEREKGVGYDLEDVQFRKRRAFKIWEKDA